MKAQAPTVRIPAILTHLGDLYDFAAAATHDDYVAVWSRARSTVDHYVEVNRLPEEPPDDLDALEETKSKLFGDLRPALRDHLLTAAVRLTAEEARRHKDIFARQIPYLIDRNVIPAGPAHVLMESAKIFLGKQIQRTTYLADDINQLIEFALLYKNFPEKLLDGRGRRLGDAYAALERLSFEATEEELLADAARGIFHPASVGKFPGLQEAIHMRFSRIMQNCTDWKRLKRDFGITPAVLESARCYNLLAEESYKDVMALIPPSRWPHWSDWFRFITR